MVKPIPDNVKDLLSQLPSSQQVVLRSYIATLRSEIVSFEEEKLNADNTDPHAHYHGDVKCTADHSHVDTEHIKHHHEHVHTEHCQHEHDHKDAHAHATKNSHDHQEHKHTDHGCEHGHDHKEKHEEHVHHMHSDEHDHKEHHEHEHGHDHHDDIPAWKKAALGADPTAAPFGGNWQTESNVSATDEMKNSAAMEE